jgi:HEPN domain-containing protein
MKPKRYPPNDPREWLRRAHSNLALAQVELPEVDLADLCFDAQHPAEKGLKAVFVHRGTKFPYTHDLERLLRLLQRAGLKVPKYVLEAKHLTRFAVSTRYPALANPVTNREHRRAVRIATRVLRWAEQQVT